MNYKFPNKTLFTAVMMIIYTVLTICSGIDYIGIFMLFPSITYLIATLMILFSEKKITSIVLCGAAIFQTCIIRFLIAIIINREGLFGRDGGSLENDYGEFYIKLLILCLCTSVLFLDFKFKSEYVFIKNPLNPKVSKIFAIISICFELLYVCAFILLNANELLYYISRNLPVNVKELTLSGLVINHIISAILMITFIVLFLKGKSRKIISKLIIITSMLTQPIAYIINFISERVFLKGSSIYRIEFRSVLCEEFGIEAMFSPLYFLGVILAILVVADCAND